MFLHQSVNLEYNLYHACEPWHKQRDWSIERCEEEYVYTHTWVAHLRFWNFELLHCHQPAQMAFRGEVVPILQEVHPFLCTSSESADYLVCHFGKEGSRQLDINKPLPGVFPSQPSPFDAQETQLPASSLHGLQHKFAWPGVTFPLLPHVKSLLWPFCPYSTPGACQTVLAVPDLLALLLLRSCWKTTRN